MRADHETRANVFSFFVKCHVCGIQSCNFRLIESLILDGNLMPPASPLHPLRRQPRMQRLAEHDAQIQPCTHHACLAALKKPDQLCVRCKRFLCKDVAPADQKAWIETRERGERDEGPERTQPTQSQSPSPPKLTVKQRATIGKLQELSELRHYRCICEMAGEVLEVAADLRTTEPCTAGQQNLKSPLHL